MMYTLIKENKNGLTKVIAESKSLEKIFNKIKDLKLEEVESDDCFFYDRDLQLIDKILDTKDFYFRGYFKKFIFRVYFIKKEK